MIKIIILHVVLYDLIYEFYDRHFFIYHIMLVLMFVEEKYFNLNYSLLKLV